MDTIKNWFSNNKKGAWLIIGVVVVVIALVTLTGGGGNFLSGTAGVTCPTDQITANPNLGQIMAEFGMNVRTQPNINAPRLGGLAKCATFQILGRSPDGQWLEVSDSHGLQGWIKYSVYDGNIDNEYERFGANVNIANVPNSTNTYKAPVYVDSDPGTGSIAVVVEGDSFNAQISGLPVNVEYYVLLAPERNPGKAVLVANGKTDANGGAFLQYVLMPPTWIDGSSAKAKQLMIGVFLAKNDAQVASLSFTR